MKSLKLIAAATALTCAGVAHAELVVVVHPKHPAASLTMEQVANIYLGKNQAFAPVDMPESSASRNEFYQKVAGKDPAQVKTIWARLIFTGKTQPPKEVSNSAEAVKHVANDEKAIAYVEKSAVDGSVKAVLTVN